MTREEQRARKAQQERMRQVERRHKEAARGQMDLPFLILTLLLTVIGLIMLFSASFPRAYYDTGDGTYYFKRQAAFAALGHYPPQPAGHHRQQSYPMAGHQGRVPVPAV